MPSLHVTRCTTLTLNAMTHVDQCTYGRLSRKSTHIFHDSTWTPHGTSGDGKCHESCGQGSIVNGRFNHTQRYGSRPELKPKGQGAIKVRNSVAPHLLEEILGHVIRESPNPRARIVIDLCSGYQSLGPIAQKLGCTYIAVDMVGDRNLDLHEPPSHKPLIESKNPTSEPLFPTPRTLFPEMIPDNDGCNYWDPSPSLC